MWFVAALIAAIVGILALKSFVVVPEGEAFSVQSIERV